MARNLTPGRPVVLAQGGIEAHETGSAVYTALERWQAVDADNRRLAALLRKDRVLRLAERFGWFAVGVVGCSLVRAILDLLL